MSTSDGSGDQLYRLSDETIARWTRRLLLAMPVGVAAGIGLGLLADAWLGPDSWLGILAVVVAVGGVIVPLWAACVMGGYAVHRRGWVLGLLLPPAVAGVVAGSAHGGWWTVLGFAGLVAVGAGFWLVGHLGGVPMWTLPFRSGGPNSPVVPGVVVSRGSAERRRRRDGRPPSGPPSQQ